MAKKSIDMSQHFSIGKLLKYTAPSIGMMLFTSIYGIVDGIFIARFAGTTAFAAVNFILPVIMILGTVGFMVGTGGSALIASARGAGDEERARRYFNLLVYFAIICGFVLGIVGWFIMRPIAAWLGATGELLNIAERYGRICMVALPFFTSQYAFQAFCNTAGKPSLGLAVTIASGCINMALDALFVAGFGWGVDGAAWATACAEVVGGGVPLIYFARKNGTPFRLGKTKMDWRCIGKTCANGSSEMVGSIAMSLVSMLYNYLLLRYFGENGVATYGAVLYVGWIATALCSGYSVGCAPLMSFQYGAGNDVEKRSLFKKSVLIYLVGDAVLFIVAMVFAGPLTAIFTGYDPELHALATQVLRIFAPAILFMGLNIYGSSLFTSLENGPISALIAFLRTVLFEAGAALALPLIFGPMGIWFSFLVAEGACFIMAVIILLLKAKDYGLRGPLITEEAARDVTFDAAVADETVPYAAAADASAADAQTSEADA